MWQAYFLGYLLEKQKKGGVPAFYCGFYHNHDHIDGQNKK